MGKKQKGKNDDYFNIQYAFLREEICGMGWGDYSLFLSPTMCSVHVHMGVHATTYVCINT